MHVSQLTGVQLVDRQIQQTNNVLGWQITDGGNDGLGHTGGNTASEPILSDTDQLALRRGRHGDGLALHCLQRHQSSDHREKAQRLPHQQRKKKTEPPCSQAQCTTSQSFTLHSAAARNQRAVRFTKPCMHAPSSQASLQKSRSPRAFVEVVTYKVRKRGGHGT